MTARENILINAFFGGGRQPELSLPRDRNAKHFCCKPAPSRLTLLLLADRHRGMKYRSLFSGLIAVIVSILPAHGAHLPLPRSAPQAPDISSQAIRAFV